MHPCLSVAVTSTVSVHCADEVVSECGVTDVPTQNTPMPSNAYVPPNPEPTSSRVDLVLDSYSEYCDACASASPPTERNVPRRSHGATSGVSSVPSPSMVSARVSASGGGNAQTLPRLELHEPTLTVNVIDVQLPWLFWVQQHSKKQELEDIIDIMEYVAVTELRFGTPQFQDNTAQCHVCVNNLPIIVT